MKTVFTCLSFLFIFDCLSQVTGNFEQIDNKMSTIPSKKTKSEKEIANYINSNFTTEKEKIRAVYFWIATNISYDIENINNLPSEETDKERISRTLQTHKGVCADYSMVFNEIAKLLGIKSFVISGYTKQYGKIDDLSHAWCACKIDNEWYLFDPTWGAGYVSNNKFVPKFNNDYFMQSPTQMINSHMPFDYLWQFLPFPISNQEFIEGKSTTNQIKYDFETEINKYESLTTMDKYFESVQRIEEKGIKNKLILEAYNHAKEAWKIERDNSTNEKYNQVVDDFNDAINGLNNFVIYRNNQFKPSLPDEEIKAKIQIPNEKLQKCRETILKITATNKETAANINRLTNQIEKALVQSEIHLQFVNEYLTKDSSIRETMFFKSSRR